MYAIMTELSSQDARWVENVRSIATDACGGDPVPLKWPLHLSWQGAESYQLDEAEKRIGMIARTFAPIVTRFEGIGVFTGPEPVFYLPITRTPELTALNMTLWEAMAHLMVRPNAYFSPDQWVPHITILYGNEMVADAVSCMIEKLLIRPLHLEITLDHIYMGYFNDDEYGTKFRFPLLGRSEPPAQ